MQANHYIDRHWTELREGQLADHVLIDRTQQGDQEAFGILWERYAPGVRAVVNRFAQQPADIDDLAQEVFLKAFTAISRFRGDSRFFSWLYRIAFNTGINFSAAKSRSEQSNMDNLELSTDVDPQQTCIETERRRAAESAIRELPPALRQTLLLNTVKGFDYKVVGTLVGCPIGTVRSRISRARSSLTAALAD